jgi:hypothetical protein
MKMNMKVKSAGTLFIILIIGMLLFLVLMPKVSEGFMDAGRCGVDLLPCSGERIRCMNGYCKSDIPPKLPPVSDLPMTPPTKYLYSPPQ